MTQDVQYQVHAACGCILLMVWLFSTDAAAQYVSTLFTLRELLSFMLSLGSTVKLGAVAVAHHNAEAFSGLKDEGQGQAHTACRRTGAGSAAAQRRRPPAQLDLVNLDALQVAQGSPVCMSLHKSCERSLRKQTYRLTSKELLLSLTHAGILVRVKGGYIRVLLQQDAGHSMLVVCQTMLAHVMLGNFLPPG